MTLTLKLQPEIERDLSAQAHSRGVSLTDYAQEILAREAKGHPVPHRRTGQELIDASAKIAGRFTDEEIDQLSRRHPSPGRPVDLE